MMVGGIGYKILYCVFREILFHFSIQLSGECFVVADDQCRLVQSGYHIGHRKGLAGPRNPEECLELIALP